MSSRKTTIPPLLHPYLSLPPEASLLLLTGVLNASTHWLSVRVLKGALGETSSSEEDVAVVLVSWQRDFEFWKTEARRGAGLDLARLAQQDRFAFVDGLTHLLSPPTPTPSSTPTAPAAQTLPLRQQPAVPTRTHTTPTPRRIPPTAITTTPQQTPTNQNPPQPKNQHTLTNPALPHAQTTITKAITALRATNPNRPILLLLDNPSTPLALTSTPSATPLQQLLLSLRAQVSSTVISLDIDLPFLQPSVHALAQAASVADSSADGQGDVIVKSPLETEMARLLVGVAHQARYVVSVRGLDTGVARDVSGVVRCSRGGAWDDDNNDDEDDEDQDTKQGRSKAAAEKEIEVLYFVQGDGGVNVFERGGGEIG